jgi:hypothetical protein
MTTEELKQRTRRFALRVTQLVDALPNTVKGRAIANQITRSAQIEPLLQEVGELVAIMAASRKSAIGNRKSAIQ